MKSLATIVVAAFAVAVFTSSQVRADPLEGTWSGGGYVEPKDGTRESVRCRITYNRHTSTVYRVTALCASTSTKVHQTGEVLRVNANRYVGDFYNPDYDISGRVRVSISGSQQTVTFSSKRGSGSVTLTK
jgi:hypothetical protein